MRFWKRKGAFPFSRLKEAGRDWVSPGDWPEPLHETEGRVKLMRDTSAARWLEERLWHWGNEGVPVGSVVPEGFEAYARILHPAYKRPDGGGEEEPVRWSTVAAWTGRVVHSQMQFERFANLAQHEFPPWDSPPMQGVLPRRECERVAGLLRSFTSTPASCWFGIWDGYGFFDPKRYSDIPRVRAQHRDYLLFRGPIDAVTGFAWGLSEQSPNLWWPEDEAWCVATDIDLSDTYIGGSDECIDRVLADGKIEAFRTTLDARVDIDGDTINLPA
jgi:hypothetical protein